MARSCTDIIFLIVFLIFFAGYGYLSHEILTISEPAIILSDTALKAFQDLGDARVIFEELYRDLTQCWQFILFGLSYGAFITFIWILALRYNAAFVVWSTVFSLPILLSVALYYSMDSFVYFLKRRPVAGSGPVIDDQMLAFDQAIQTILKVEVLSYTQNETFWFVVSLVLITCLVILTLLLHGLKKRIRLSIALIREASKAISGVKSTLVFPVAPRLMSLSVALFGAFIALLIMGGGHPAYRTPEGKLCNPNATLTTMPKPPSIPIFAEPRSPLVSRQHITIRRPGTQECYKQPPLLPSKHLWKFHIYNLLATLWLIHFLDGITETTLAGAFASYYWAFRKPRDVPFFAVTASLWRVIRYHLGSIAFGSFLLATVNLIRIMIEYLSSKWRSKNQASTVGFAEQALTSKMSWCFRGLFWLLDRFLRFVDRNAYIVMSMYGDGFFTSAKKALGLLMRNSTRAVVLDYITDFVLLISRLLVTAISGILIAFVFSEKMPALPPEMSINVPAIGHRWLPIFLVILGTYFIAKGFFSVYGMAVDTLFMCFLIDCEHNDGSYERPYYMSKGLKRILKRNPQLRSISNGPPNPTTLATNSNKNVTRGKERPSAPSLSQLADMSKV